MGRNQPIRGNPEQKMLFVINDFSGGANLLFSDDLTLDNELRYLENFDLEIRGELRSRKGFSRNTALSEALFGSADTSITQFPLITEDSSLVKEVALMKLIVNENNAWKNLADSENLAQYQTYWGAESNTIKLFILAKLADNTTRYYVNTYEITASTVNRSYVTGILPFELVLSKNLTNIVTGDLYGKIYFTSNNYGMVVYDSEDNSFTYMGEFPAQTNSAYKPTGIEVRKIGFNVLGDDPLTWTNNSTLTTPSIQGLYLTTTDRIPLSVIPTGTPIQLNIIHTGTYHDFTITAYEYEEDIDIVATKNNTLSTSAISVYDIVFKTHPSVECQFNVNFTSTSVTLDDYIDYYNTGQIPAEAKTVETLNVGGYKVVKIYDRLVYYNDNELWFSEVNTFDYIPNYNYILVPLDADDAITAIKFFRTSYMLFTRKKIWKLIGSFDSSSLSIEQVTDEAGCIAPNSIQLMNNKMYFLSTLGLRALKTDRFIANLENLEKFDDKVVDLVTRSKDAYTLVYGNQMLILANDRGTPAKATVRGRTFDIPDILHLYYDYETFSFSKWAKSKYPRFILSEAGELFSFMAEPSLTGHTCSVYQYGKGYDDFGERFDCIVETSGLNFGYPLHEKKIKNLIFKFGPDSELNTVYISVYGDGKLVHDTSLDFTESSDLVEIQNSQFKISKELLPAKCKNIAVRLEIKDGRGLDVQSIAYNYKLGKVREQ